MKNSKIWLLMAIAILVSAALVFPGRFKMAGDDYTAQEALPSFSDAILQFGSYGEDVYELQGRLKFLGFYHGKIDSVFGSKTQGAVKWFQSEFGLKVDGIVGPKVKLRLYNATKDWKPTEPKQHEGGGGGGGGGRQAAGNGSSNLGSANTMGLSENDLKIMANAVYGEARGEPFEGQVAVASVILNRVRSPEFPNTIHGVIFQPLAFTAVADGQIWLEPNDQARKAVMQALNGWDPTGGCIYYFNPRTATSKWIWSRPQVKTIGEHIFCM